jgi:hypothetical protein
MDLQQKEIIGLDSPRILVIGARATGKTTIINEKAKGSKYIVLVPSEMFKDSYRSLNKENIVTLSQFFYRNIRERIDSDAIVFVDELDSMHLSKYEIASLLEINCKQIYILGTPRSLEAKFVLDDTLGYLRFKLEFKSDLLQMYYDFQNNIYWSMRILSFLDIPERFKYVLPNKEFEAEFLPLAK